MDDMQFNALTALLERIASSLEHLAYKNPGGAVHPMSAPGEERQHDRCEKMPDGRFKWVLSPDKKVSHCRKCNGEIFWVRTKNGKNMPCNPDGYSHFDSCPGAGNPVSTSVPEEKISNDDVPF